MNVESDDELDPRVQIELENLNCCTDEINRLEIQLDEANAQFRTGLSESTDRLKSLSSRLGKCIEKARPYYSAVDFAKTAQLECQKAAIHFQRAACLHATAKQTIALAEQKFQCGKEEWQFDTAWQEMLNHATAKVTEADGQRAESEREHQRRAIIFAQAEQTVQNLEHKLKSAIIKSKPYFETKDIYQRELQLLKERVQGLQKAVIEAKGRYAQSLKNLEVISEQIHEKRRFLMPREPGVGAEKLDLPLEDHLQHVSISDLLESPCENSGSSWPSCAGERERRLLDEKYGANNTPFFQKCYFVGDQRSRSESGKDLSSQINVPNVPVSPNVTTASCCSSDPKPVVSSPSSTESGVGAETVNHKRKGRDD